MQSVPRQSQTVPTGWTGAPRLMEAWLGRQCALEKTVNLVGGVVFLILGLAGFVFTSCVAAGIIFLILIYANAPLALVGLAVFPVSRFLFVSLFLLFLGLSVAHAYKTRWGTDSAANVDLGTAFSSLTSLGWEFFSAGPILLILSGQEFHRYLRLSRLDVPHVSTILLWLYDDKRGRASFAEVCLAFPGLNSVRVLPQLRDIPGMNWWPEDGAVSISENLHKIFVQILGREPKNSPSSGGNSRKRQAFESPAPELDKSITAWYATLHLPLFASLQQVKKQYRKLAKIHHPDAQPRGRAAGGAPDDEEMKRINEAYHNLLKHSQQQAGASR